MHLNKVRPITGAAIYEAGYDDGRPCVWMTTPKDEHGEESYYVLDPCKKIETAIKRAEAWQRKENKSVVKNYMYNHNEMPNRFPLPIPKLSAPFI